MADIVDRQARLLIDPPAAGAWNMAVDEALLESAAERGTATLRFYEWSEPTLSLGYFQDARERRSHLASHDCPLIRRASGGGAILHHHELTYSIAVPDRRGLGESARELYELLHLTLIESLQSLGVSARLHRDCSTPNRAAETDRNHEPFLCFQRRTCFDVVHGGSKIAGSAQRRRKGAVLQHGSVLLATSPHAPQLPGVCDVAGVAVPAPELAERWRHTLAANMATSFVPGTLSTHEEERATKLDREKFGSHLFTNRR